PASIVTSTGIGIGVYSPSPSVANEARPTSVHADGSSSKPTYVPGFVQIAYTVSSAGLVFVSKRVIVSVLVATTSNMLPSSSLSLSNGDVSVAGIGGPSG